VRKVYEERIIPFWSGKTMREKIFAAMEPAWQAAFAAGVITEFMEQRAPGHAILDDKIYHRGLSDFKQDIVAHREALDYLNDLRAYDKAEQYRAMEICAEASICLARRHAELATKMALAETDPQRKQELHMIADVCQRVPAEAPRNFWEALQAYWFVHLSVILEINTWDSFNPGRLDQHLMPFYSQGLQDKTLSQDQARELLQCFWIKFNNQPAPPKVGVTEEQSGTYQDFALINVGGLTVDEGKDAVNDLSYMILDVVDQMHLIQPSACIQVSRENPDRFLHHACRIVRHGSGQPSIFNTDVILKEMSHDGKTVADGRAGGPSGCVTISAFGKESTVLTGYINWPKILELVCSDGYDLRTGQQVGPHTGDPCDFTGFDQFIDAYKTQLSHFLDVKIKGNNLIERLFARFMPTPFMSVVMDDCIATGRDYHDGGARYNPTYIQGVGLGTVSDCLAALKYHVYDERDVDMPDLLTALKADFNGYETLHHKLTHRSPRYGNDDEYADVITEQVFNIYFDLLDGRPNTKGGRYRVNLLPTTAHIYFGSVVGSLPNGRKAGAPVSDGISPSHGADTQGPTAMVKSAAVIDHSRTGGTLLNMKFNPQVLAGDDSLEKLAHLVRAYFRMGGHHIQFNVIDVDTLREAQAHPEQNQELIVRVAGYSDYFVDLGHDLQEEIVSRTEQTL
ncbi:MAG: formate C-acetyltransferase/glycerol dehydratase family glycyl radical enzyme, partial [Phycisphaeraceae bacterium]|nr:formate C-acetyltransferase/glycerol dehydratase family glycyl radical enzyme [Phycisphaeraceae bacterium]